MSIFFGDTETLSLLDVTIVGAYKMSMHKSSEVTVLGGTYDDEPNGFVWSPPWAWHNNSKDDHHLERLFDHINEGHLTVWWNAFFDRHMWNNILHRKYGWPYLPLEQVLCAQAQAEANNLPSGLGKAAECLGTPYKKDPKGKQLIDLLCHGSRKTWDSETNETNDRMGHFRSYCLKDVMSMRDVWDYTRPLMAWEWDEYHASERINDRGIMVDIEFAKAAKVYADAEMADVNKDLAEVTGDDLITITNHIRKSKWLNENLWPDPELQALTEKLPNKSSPDKPRYTCDRPTREAVLDLLNTPEHGERFEPEQLQRVVGFLEAIEAGNSAAVRKFNAMINQEFESRVYGSYVFNGAGQTGRYSSRGIQVHNLIRAPLDKEDADRAIDAIDMIVAGGSPDDLVNEFGFPISRLLARLIRPTFIAPDGKTLVWGDWDQIEGRVLPWLSDSTGGNDKLELFASGVDVYSVTAADISGMPVHDIDDHTRQSMGKVPELALGFGGSVGAFSAMGRSYGVTLPEAKVKQIVDKWRNKNQWCVDFWFELWEAAMLAFHNPGEWYQAGRVQYMYHPQLMRGTLICQLPCGRWIVYPHFKHELTVVEDDDGNEITRWVTSCVKGFGGGYGRVNIWHGTLAENITQAVAASILRATLVDLDDLAVLHTHDEIVLEVDEMNDEIAADMLKRSMEFLPEWATGLPLSATIESGPFYTK